MASTQTRDTVATETTAWMRLARGAAVTMVIWAIILQLTAGTVIPPVLVVGLVFLGFAPFLAGERRRLGLAFAIATAVLFLGNLPMILDELRHPDSAPAFILTLLSTIGAVTAFTSGLGAFLRWSIQPIRTVAVAGAAVFVAGTVGSLAIASGVESDGAGPADVAVVAEQVAFAPVDLTMDAAESGVWVDNRDGIRHTFTIPELGVDLEIPALKAKRVDIDAAPGTYQIICTVPGHETMTGTLTVTG